MPTPLRQKQWVRRATVARQKIRGRLVQRLSQNLIRGLWRRTALIPFLIFSSGWTIIDDFSIIFCYSGRERCRIENKSNRFVSISPIPQTSFSFLPSIFSDAMDLDQAATEKSQHISTHGPRGSRREEWRVANGMSARPTPSGMNRQGGVAARRKAGRSKRRRWTLLYPPVTMFSSIIYITVTSHSRSWTQVCRIAKSTLLYPYPCLMVALNVTSCFLSTWTAIIFVYFQGHSILQAFFELTICHRPNGRMFDVPERRLSVLETMNILLAYDQCGPV